MEKLVPCHHILVEASNEGYLPLFFLFPQPDICVISWVWASARWVCPSDTGCVVFFFFFSSPGWEKKCWNHDISQKHFVSFICYLPTATCFQMARICSHLGWETGWFCSFFLSIQGGNGVGSYPLLQSPTAKCSNTERRLKCLLCPKKLEKREILGFAPREPHPQQARLLFLSPRVESLITREDKKLGLLSEACRERLRLYQLR